MVDIPPRLDIFMVHLIYWMIKLLLFQKHNCLPSDHYLIIQKLDLQFLIKKLFTKTPPGWNVFLCQGSKEMHVCLLFSRESLHVLGFVWHAWN